MVTWSLLEVYLKYILQIYICILQVYLKYILQIYFRSIVPVYLKYILKVYFTLIRVAPIFPRIRLGTGLQIIQSLKRFWNKAGSSIWLTVVIKHINKILPLHNSLVNILRARFNLKTPFWWQISPSLFKTFLNHSLWYFWIILP